MAPRSVTHWTQVFQDLYSKAGSKRTPEQIWIAITAHSSAIGECIRRTSYRELVSRAAHAFCWICSFVAKCNELEGADIFSLTDSLSGIVSLKYPSVCGHCLGSPCRCDPVSRDAEENKAAKYADLCERREGMLEAAERYSFDAWRKTFDNLYAGRTHMLTLESIGFHFLEEVGEGAVTVRKLFELRTIAKQAVGIDLAFLENLRGVRTIVEQYQEYAKHQPNGVIEYDTKAPAILQWRVVEAKMGMLVEIADTFSWLCAIMNKLQEIAGSSGFELPSLEKQLEIEYLDEVGNPRCPTCKRRPCACVFFH